MRPAPASPADSVRSDSERGSPRGRRGLWLLAVVVGFAGCKDGSKPDADAAPPVTPTEDALADGAIPGVTRAQLLGAVGACTLETARAFAARVVDLDAATAALAATPGPDRLQAARAAFTAAFDTWQIAEAMQVGPAAPATAAGGMDLRDQIYSWPLISRCAVEEHLVTRGWESPGLDKAAVSRRGLAALEYLLFFEGPGTACTATSPIVANGTWAALSADEIGARKRAYAVAVVADLGKRAAALVTAWDPAVGNFLGTLTGGGPGNPTFGTPKQAFNAVGDALFFLERDTKDTKMARPLGLRDCGAGICPDLLESPHTGRAIAGLRGNLTGFRRLMQGCGPGFSGVGFDDLLVAIGAHDLATRLDQREAAAAALIEAQGEARLADLLTRDVATVRGIYDGLREITTLLKTEVKTVLDLELPAGIEGDND